MNFSSSCSQLEDYSIGLNELADTFIRPTPSEIRFNSTQFSEGYNSLVKLSNSAHFEKINGSHKEKNKIDRDYITNLFEVIIFLTKQGILFRDQINHNKKINSGKQEKGHSENLIEFLKFRSRDLPFLKAFIDSGNSLNYLSHKIENEFIEIIHEQIIFKITSEIGNRPYSIILNDIAGSIKGVKTAFILRYVDKQGKIQERFISFESAVFTSGAELERLILKKLKYLKLSPSKIAAQAHEGINGTMNNIYKDLAGRITAGNPMALFVHNSSRRLNTTLQYACSSIPEIRDAIATLNSLFNFIEAYGIRYSSVSKSQNDNTVYQTIKQLSISHWSSRKLTVIAMKQTFTQVLECLKTILGFKAKILLANIDSFEFFLTIHILELILKRTQNLSDTLKTNSCELDTVFKQDIIHATVQSLYELRSDESFTELFHWCCKYADKYGIKRPQIKRANSDLSNIVYYDYNLYETGPKVKFIEQKYHTLFFKTIDSTIDEIEFRYQDTTLLPIVQMAKAIRNADAECVYELKKLQVYNEIVDFNKLQNEIALWRHIRNQSSFNECCWNLRLENFIRKNESRSEVPTILSKEKGIILSKDFYSINEIYQAFNHLQLAQTLPQLDKLYRIYLTIPVSNTGVKRTKSVLKRSKHWLQNTIEKDVAENLALLNIEKELTEAIDIELVINKYEQQIQFLSEN